MSNHENLALQTIISSFEEASRDIGFALNKDQANKLSGWITILSSLGGNPKIIKKVSESFKRFQTLENPEDIQDQEAFDFFRDFTNKNLGKASGKDYRLSAKREMIRLLAGNHSNNWQKDLLTDAQVKILKSNLGSGVYEYYLKTSPELMAQAFNQDGELLMENSVNTLKGEYYLSLVKKAEQDAASAKATYDFSKESLPEVA